MVRGTRKLMQNTHLAVINIRGCKASCAGRFWLSNENKYKCATQVKRNSNTMPGSKKVKNERLEIINRCFPVSFFRHKY